MIFAIVQAELSSHSVLPLYSHQLTEQDRLSRIGELLCRAILRAEFASPKPSARGEPPKEAGPAAEQIIVNYLRFFGTAAPAELRLTLGLSKSTANRSLQRLLEHGRVAVAGRTRNAAYRLTDFDPSRN